MQKILITCEHGGRKIPAEYVGKFAEHQALLETHRGWDPGALNLARQLAKSLDAPLVFSETSRLLVDVNRSEHHRALFSLVSRALPRDERTRILDEYYRPYRAEVAANGLEAVAAVKRQAYDVILMDMQMPELDGLEATRRIRTLRLPHGQQPRIIAMTANAMQGDREACLAAGMDDYSPKPVQMADLQNALERSAQALQARSPLNHA